MTGVNDLATQWRKMLNRTDAGYYSMTVCAGELEELARTVWHPVSEPPTEADGDDWNEVVAFRPDGSITTEKRFEVHKYADYWARINDVVLMPPEDK